MHNHSGHSFIEVLISLSLITTSSFLLMNQHATMHQLFFQLYQQTMQMFQHENGIEQEKIAHFFVSGVE